MLQLAGQLLPLAITVIYNHIVQNRHIALNENIKDRIQRCAVPALLQISAQGLGYLTGMAILGVSVSPIGWAAFGTLAIIAIFLTIHQNKRDPKIILTQLAIAVGTFALSILNTIVFSSLSIARTGEEEARFSAKIAILLDPSKQWVNDEYLRKAVLPALAIFAGIIPSLMGTLGHIGHYLYSKFRPISIQLDPEGQYQASGGLGSIARIFRGTPAALKPIPVEFHDDPELSKVMCPISLAPVRDPVRDPIQINHIYDRAHIAAWLINNNTSPLNRAPLFFDQLVEMPELRNQIDTRLQFLTDKTPRAENDTGPTININLV